MRGADRGTSCGEHAEVAGKTRRKRAGDEGDGRLPPETVARVRDTDRDRDDDDEEGQPPVLGVQKRRGAFLDLLRDPLHPHVTRILLHDPAEFDNGEDQCDERRTDEQQRKQHELLRILLHSRWQQGSSRVPAPDSA